MSGAESPSQTDGSPQTDTARYASNALPDSEASTPKAMTIKPKLRLISGLWFCMTRHNTGTGATKAEAFDRWTEAIKTGAPCVWQ